MMAPPKPELGKTAATPVALPGPAPGEAPATGVGQPPVALRGPGAGEAPATGVGQPPVALPEAALGEAAATGVGQARVALPAGMREAAEQAAFFARIDAQYPHMRALRLGFTIIPRDFQIADVYNMLRFFTGYEIYLEQRVFMNKQLWVPFPHFHNILLQKNQEITSTLENIT